ncbi:SurA N-terminal domain-containing protein [Halomonas denitrificans]|uniref:SurA N-terminal domain-containing protein n=1 Tax=Halomonas denitrificans TaxID=370769 RepID=UPI001CD600CE|nr:SurA N-terminal domain-containing protein [Halomonas denitrificans]MCA0973551.1 SurA N-terminal domain-containing protein [Halomonas denitrificans]
MLQSIRDRSQSWIAKIIIGAVVVTMALFGVESLIGLFGQSGDEVAKVNGQPINRQQVEVNVQRAMRANQVPADQERALRREVLEGLISDRLMISYAESGGLAVSDNQLDQLIVSRPEFHNADGQFDQELFRQRLASVGYTPLSFREQLSRDVMRGHIQQGLIASDFTLPAEQQRLAQLQRQTRTFRYHTMDASELDQPVSVSDAEMSAYYSEHQQDFLRPEQVQLAYVLLDQEAMAADVEVSEDELRAAWEASAENADRRVSHIMVTFGDERTRDEAEARIADLQSRLAQGEDFETLAAEFSDDTTTSDAGGDLGVITRGIFGDDFEQAAFALQQGQVSDVVETDNGLHLIKVTELDRPDFEQERDRLRDRLAQEQVRDDFNDTAQQLIDESFAADDLQSVADAIGVDLVTTDWVSRDSAEGVLAEPGVMDQAFSEEVLDEGFNSEVIELDGSRRLVLRALDHRDATTLPLEEVSSDVEAAVRGAKTRDALIELASERVAQLQGGQSLELDWQQADAISRQDAPSVPDAVLTTAFKLPHPQEGGVVYGRAVEGDQVTLIALDAIGEAQGNPQMEQFVSSMAERLRAQAILDGLLSHLEEVGDIERY